MKPCRGIEVGGIIQTKQKISYEVEKNLEDLHIHITKPDKFPFVITEEWVDEVAAQVIKFLLNPSKERFCLVNHRIYEGKIIHINREAA